MSQRRAQQGTSYGQEAADTRTRQCSGCGQRTLKVRTGGGRSGGLDVVLDPEPLDASLELLEVLAGGVTFTRHTVSDEVHHRGPFEIRTRPAGTRARQLVLRQHRCGTSPLPQRVADGGQRAQPLGDAPPF